MNRAPNGIAIIQHELLALLLGGPNFIKDLHLPSDAVIYAILPDPHSPLFRVQFYSDELERQLPGHWGLYPDHDFRWSEWDVDTTTIERHQ